MTGILTAITDGTRMTAAIDAMQEAVEDAGRGAAVIARLKAELGADIIKDAAEADFDPAMLVSNIFTLEWPPRSSRMRSFPEIDRVQWFTLAEAGSKVVPGQAGFLDRLAAGLPRARTDPQSPGSTVVASAQAPAPAVRKPRAAPGNSEE